MKSPFANPARGERLPREFSGGGDVQGGFSLVEILLVIVMLSIIIIGLMAMFGQTQRAFRAGMTQVDVLESGRMATDLILRELEQVRPSRLPYSSVLPNSTVIIQPNFYAWFPTYAPLVLPLAGSTTPRTNLLEELFFLTLQNREWVAIAYFVRTNDPVTGALDWPVVSGPQSAPTLGAGTLYRFETNAHLLSVRTPAQMYDEFRAAAVTGRGVSKIMDGVVHFKVRAYDTNGVWLTNNLPGNSNFSKSDILMSHDRAANNVPGDVVQYIFYSNAVPAAVEVELGILEDRSWDRYNSMLDPAGQYRYLTNQVGRVHVFRHRVPVRNVDPQAYR